MRKDRGINRWELVTCALAGHATYAPDEEALAAKPSTLALLTLMLTAYALIEVIEGVGLWLLKRWGEYFAVIATSVFLPLEIHDLAKGITMTRVVTFSINILAVIYLLISK